MVEKNRLPQEEIKRRWRILCIMENHLPNDTGVRKLFMYYRNNVRHRNKKIIFQYILVGMGFATPELKADGLIGGETWRSLRNFYKAAGFDSE